MKCQPVGPPGITGVLVALEIDSKAKVGWNWEAELVTEEMIIYLRLGGFQQNNSVSVKKARASIS